MSLEYNLQQERVTCFDLTNFTAVEIGTSVKTTIEKMRAEHQRCAVIVDNAGALVGIFTDRDILRRVVDVRDTWDLPIDDIMTPSPTSVNANDQADVALALMDYKHFRNIPVLDDEGTVVGNLTHYAIIKYLNDRFSESASHPPLDSDAVASEQDSV
jgi:CBS domain-containing protein